MRYWKLISMLLRFAIQKKNKTIKYPGCKWWCTAVYEPYFTVNQVSGLRPCSMRIRYTYDHIRCYKRSVSRSPGLQENTARFSTVSDRIKWSYRKKYGWWCPSTRVWTTLYMLPLISKTHSIFYYTCSTSLW